MKNFIFLFIFIILNACSKKAHSVLPDNSLNKTETISTPDNSSLSQKERIKIASIVGVAPKKINNDKLYAFIYDWLNTPYLYGGETKRGIDCSSITEKLITNIYNIKLPRTSNKMFWSDKINLFKKKRNLKEGDLVFFRINKENTISHVGVYLQNNKFFSSNVNGGVSISNLNSNYWSNCYVASGRVKHNTTTPK